MIVLNTHENFWINYPDYLSLEIFRDLYSKDKSKHKEESSKMIWAILLYMHPKSLYFNFDKKQKEDLISKNYYKLDLKKSKEFISIFDKILLTAAKRSLVQWNNTMDERSEFMSKQKFDNSTWEMLDKMTIATPKLYAELERIQDMLDKEGDEGSIQGGGELSASEGGLI